jgi:hypothetical protein
MKGGGDGIGGRQGRLGPGWSVCSKCPLLLVDMDVGLVWVVGVRVMEDGGGRAGLGDTSSELSAPLRQRVEVLKLAVSGEFRDRNDLS